jgi:hypothetical protein
MGFNITTLGPESRKIVLELSPLIIAAMRKAHTELSAGRGATECARWFGATPTNTVKEKVGKLRSFFNCNSITIRFATLQKRGTNNAAALAPGNGWKDYTNLTKANGVSFEMYLNSGWEAKPKRSTLPLATAGSGGQFKTLVHELSHLGLNTEDHKYQAASCVALAASDAAKALDNADNWGFFVEEFI